MAEASSLHCPNCGAAVRHESGRCPYCQARLATISCPSCFALMFEGAAFCHACGAARTRTQGDETAIACPGCRSPLANVAIGATSLLECTACDGVWIDAATFERLCADRESQTAVLHRPERPAAAPAETRVRYRPCPRCGKMMNRINFGTLSGAVVDVCRGHGTFLDAGELHQIVRFILDGGLDRARERRREDRRDEERRTRDEQRKASRDGDNRRPGAARRTVDASAMLDILDLLGSE
ncbi:MAG TPA: zf-TFIIB domain-containing protein [Vicinamibacterales bacterium]|nr:zf-TFIIB domain-containing protein [Vicinamibacterales bacterium]